MRQIRDLGFGALLYRPAAIRALCEADAGTADGSGVFPSLTLLQGPAALAPLARLSLLPVIGAGRTELFPL